ncbi:MAG: CPBP family intramembrane glutamic endopeptidase [Chloroflexota bacterium]
MKSRSVLLETILVITVTLLGMWFVPAAKTLFALIPIAYLLIERRLRKRTWTDLGFSIRTFWADLRANWILFVLVGFIMQPAAVLWAKAYFPEFLAHVQARLPFESGIGWGVLLPLLAVSLLGEEMTYRTLLQGRLAPFVGAPAAVVVGSVLFGLAHFASGPALIVAVDVGLIVADSVLYGTMFARRNNLWVVWLAHFIGDVFGLLVLASV